MANETVFKRYEHNPIVTAANVPRANSIHNRAIVRFNGAYAGVFRVDEIDLCYRLHVGSSDDGIRWDIDPDPITMTSDDPDITVSDHSYDPRLQEIDEGWLLIYHGVWRSCNGFLYYAGGALLDLQKPWKVLHRTRDYLLAPTTSYERVGDVPNVVFPSAAVTFPETGMLRLYYGCADTCVSIAEARIGDIIEFVKTRALH